MEADGVEAGGLLSDRPAERHDVIGREGSIFLVPVPWKQRVLWLIEADGLGRATGIDAHVLNA